MDKDRYVEKVLNQSIPQLIPYKLVDEYGDFINDEMRNVVRANCLRRYLEGAIDLLIKDRYWQQVYQKKNGVVII